MARCFRRGKNYTIATTNTGANLEGFHFDIQNVNILVFIQFASSTPFASAVLLSALVITSLSLPAP